MAAVCGCGGGETGRSKGDKADGSEGTVTGEDGQSAKYGGDGEESRLYYIYKIIQYIILYITVL